ncbi:hypothetical protein BXZ70DRAFT_957678 [Cristinia sonorae]|uniref:Uncharacterized protein n=1 Tax=Cristinia sonorae TaxID=1940300 RepID=A0A8K0XKS6_9AGAR|nr:hypothetical protein BXZ70DRAFT_957678 [Cristinia sonorae]
MWGCQLKIGLSPCPLPSELDSFFMTVMMVGCTSDLCWHSFLGFLPLYDLSSLDSLVRLALSLARVYSFLLSSLSFCAPFFFKFLLIFLEDTHGHRLLNPIFL